jgi:fibronectin type 3 domain-containing protein
MKTLTLIFVLLFAGVAQAETVTLVWNANKEPDLAGYRVYKRLAGQPDYGAFVDTVTRPTYTTQELGPGLWYFVVTAVDLTGNESDQSEEVSHVVFPAPLPQDPRIAVLESTIAAIKLEVCKLTTYSTLRTALRRAMGGC